MEITCGTLPSQICEPKGGLKYEYTTFLSAFSGYRNTSYIHFCKELEYPENERVL
jgi:hypothetical protein